MDDKNNSLKANFIEKGLKDAYETPEFARSMLLIFSSLEKYQKEIQDCKTKDEALSKMLQFVEGLDLFHATAFYVVNQDFGFDLFLPSQGLDNEALDHFITSQIKEGKFAWALQQNREIVIDSPKDLPGNEAIFHGMSTLHTTLGMFVGFLRHKSSPIRQSYLKILSMIIDAVVYMYENQVLQDELTQYNQHLETIVNARTRELRHANQHLNQSNSELKKLSQKKSEFLGIVAHDLKNPLSGIIGFCDLIEDNLNRLQNVAKDEVIGTQQMLKYIGTSANQMVVTLNGLMDSEILESGKMKLDKVLLELGALVQKVTNINEAQAKSKGIKMNLEIEPGIMVNADALRIHEAVDNLISNAIKYSPHNKEIWLKVATSTPDNGPAKAVFSVKDQGPGLTEDDKSKLFGRFQKLSARPTGGESSTGLGLSIVKNLIELHNGEIDVESEHGQGATFSFSLPKQTDIKAELRAET